MQIFARVRWVLARYPVIYWLVAGGAGALVVAGVVARIEQLDKARGSWGEATTAWVATVPHVPGDPIVAEARQVPLALLADTSVTTDPNGRTAIQRLGRGEMIGTTDLGDGVGDLLPTGWRGVAISRDDVLVDVGPGDVVDVIGSGAVLVDGAVVIALDDRSVTVGVPAAEAPAVASAALERTAVLTLRGS